MSENIVPYGKQQQPTALVSLLENEQTQRIKEVPTQKITTMINRIVMIAGLPGNAIPEDSTSFPHATYLVKMIRELFGNYTPEEVVHAFKLAVKGTIKADLKTYGAMLSTEYIGAVMRSYAEYKSAIKNENRHKLISSNTDEVKTDITDDEKRKLAQDSFMLAYEQYYQKGIIANYGDTTYNFMVRNKMFSPDITEKSVMNESIKEAKAELETKREQTVYSAERTRLKDMISMFDKGQHAPERIVHSTMIKRQFDTWIRNGIKANELIKQ